MHATIFWLAFLASALALPASHFTPREDTSNEWKPAPGSVAECGVSELAVSFFIGQQKESVLKAACAVMMPRCASGSTNPDEVCIQPTEWPLKEPKTSIQDANVLKNGQRDPKFQLKFTVTPPANPTGPVQWTKDDCYGYFETLVSESPPKGCMGSVGSGIGNYTAGGDTSLKGTVFDMSIIEEA